MAKTPDDEEREMRIRLDTLKGKLQRQTADRREHAAAAAGASSGGPDGASAWTMAMRAGGEFSGAIVAGGLIGWGLDRLLGTRPWLLIGFFLLGSVVGVKNVIRVTSPKGRDGVRNSRLSDGQPPDKDGPRPASEAARQAPSGWDEDED